MTWRQLLTHTDTDSAAGAVAEVDQTYITQTRIGAVHWEDFLTDATALTYLKDTARDVLKTVLGYLPPDSVMLPFEPYLRGLIHLFWQNSLSEDDFWQQLQDHAKLIRNADLKHNTCLDYDEAIYRNYHESFAPYGYAVRDRLSSLLGYVPKLRHSLIAELWMRDIMADDSYKLPEEMTPDDVRAVTLVKYREVLLVDGVSAANASPLVLAQ